MNQLKAGGEVTCPNAHCETKQTFDSTTGFEYLLHAINCRPLYVCKSCGAEQKTYRHFENHMKKCDGFVKVGRPSIETLKRRAAYIENLPKKETRGLQHTYDADEERINESYTTMVTKDKSIKKVGKGMQKVKDQKLLKLKSSNPETLLQEIGNHLLAEGDCREAETPVVFPSDMNAATKRRLKNNLKKDNKNKSILKKAIKAKLLAHKTKGNTAELNENETDRKKMKSKKMIRFADNVTINEEESTSFSSLEGDEINFDFTMVSSDSFSSSPKKHVTHGRENTTDKLSVTSVSPISSSITSSSTITSRTKNKILSPEYQSKTSTCLTKSRTEPLQSISANKNISSLDKKKHHKRLKKQQFEKGGTFNSDSGSSSLPSCGNKISLSSKVDRSNASSSCQEKFLNDSTGSLGITDGSSSSQKNEIEKSLRGRKVITSERSSSQVEGYHSNGEEDENETTNSPYSPRAAVPVKEKSNSLTQSPSNAKRNIFAKPRGKGSSNTVTNPLSRRNSGKYTQINELNISTTQSSLKKKSKTRNSCNSEGSPEISENASYEENNTAYDFPTENTPASPVLPSRNNKVDSQRKRHNSLSEQLVTKDIAETRRKRSSSVSEKVSGYRSSTTFTSDEEQGRDIHIFYENWNNTKIKVRKCRLF